MKKCPSCRTEIFTEDKYCGNCGYNLSIQMQSNTIFTQRELKVNDIRTNLGVIYIKQGKYELAIQNFKKVLEEDPDNELVCQMLEQAQAAQNETV